MSESFEAPAHSVETLIIGAGPVGLFQIFELGLLGIRSAIIDSLAQVGGQCTELYPDKPIYDIPALPDLRGAGIDRSAARTGETLPRHFPSRTGSDRAAAAGRRQVPGRHLARHAADRGRRGDRGRSSAPSSRAAWRCPASSNSKAQSVHYRVKSAADFHGHDLVICGGGDSALDWTVALCEKARSLTLVHRRAEFRAAPATVARMRELVAAGKMRLGRRATWSALNSEHDRRAHAARWTCRRTDGDTTLHGAADHVLAFFGLHPKLGPVAEWGLELEKKALKVDTENFQTSVPGIFAIGDINTYPGKKKLILSGFHEAALAAFAIQHHLFPEKRQFLQYTTTSPIMQKRLGVAADCPRTRIDAPMNHLLEDLIKVMTLERLELDLFRGESRDIGSPQVFGGQVLGQALMAAAATVEDRAAHSLHAYFLRRGDFNAPIVYEVDRARDGNHFSTRRVVAIQHGAQIFNMSASFQSEEGGLDHQFAMPDVPPPGGAADLDAHYAADPAGVCPRDCAVLLERKRPFEFRPVQPPNISSRRRSPPLRYIWFRAVARCPTTKRCIAACWPTSRISTCSTRRCAARISPRLPQARDGQHRSRHVVSPQRAGGRLAAVFNRQPQRLGRARICARQHLCPGRTAGGEHRAGRTDARGRAMKVLIIVIIVLAVSSACC